MNLDKVRDAAEKALRKLGAACFEAGDLSLFESACAALEALGHTAPRSISADPARSGPMSAAERQRRHRERNGAASRPSRDRDAMSRNASRERDDLRDGSVVNRDAFRDEGGYRGESDQNSLSQDDPINSEKNSARTHESVTSTSRTASRQNPDSHFDGTADAFVSAISNGARHSGLSWRERDDLERVITTHCPAGQDRVAWVTKATQEYVTQTDANFWRRKPAKFGDWLDAGRPQRSSAPPSPAQQRPVQGGPPAAPIGSNRKPLMPTPRVDP